jgi:hypothetical protein
VYKVKNYKILYNNVIHIKFLFPLFALDIQLHNFMYCTRLIPLLIPLLSGNIIKARYLNECLNRLKERDQLSKECQTKNFPDKIRVTTKYAFGVRDGSIRKIEHEKVLAKMNLKFEISDKIIENWYFNDDFKTFNKIVEDWYFDDDFKTNKETYKTDDLLKVIFINSYMGTIRVLFEEINNSENKKLVDKIKKEGEKFTQKKIEWKIKFDNGIISLKVFRENRQWDPICTRKESISKNQDLLGIKLVNDSDIIVLTTKGLFIYHFNGNNKSIYLNYFYMEVNDGDNVKKEVFLKPTLPSLNYNDLKLYDKWILYIKDNKERLLKYGVELLTFAIEQHNLDLIEDIYKKCINYCKEDLENNRKFLSIITSTMPLLNKYYPDYISRYSSETNMITDSSFYRIEYKNSNLHLYSSSQYPQIINLTRSIWWCKYNLSMSEFGDNHIIMYLMLMSIQILIIMPLLLIYIFICSILLIYHLIISNVKEGNMFSIYFSLLKF